MGQGTPFDFKGEPRRAGGCAVASPRSRCPRPCNPCPRKRCAARMGSALPGADPAALGSGAASSTVGWALRHRRRRPPPGRGGHRATVGDPDGRGLPPAARGGAIVGGRSRGRRDRACAARARSSPRPAGPAADPASPARHRSRTGSSRGRGRTGARHAWLPSERIGAPRRLGDAVRAIAGWMRPQLAWQAIERIRPHGK